MDRSPTGPGRTFRRRATLRRRSSSTVDASIEDHIHHFTVTVEHSDGAIRAIAGHAVRAPWSVCPGAVSRLGDLVGQPIGSVPGVADPASHCTHLLDIALVAIRFAGSDAPSRRFDMDVRGWWGPQVTADILRDDGMGLSWTVDGGVISSPDAFAGRRLGAGFGAWAQRTLEPDLAELAVLLRRATWMSPSLDLDLDRFDRLADTPVRAASCFATQPGRLELARRNRGTSHPRLPDHSPGC